MKALTLAEIADAYREPVLIRSSSVFDAYFKAKRVTDAWWRRKFKEFNEFGPWLDAPPVRLVKHAVSFREKQAAATLSSRKRPRGENEKERMRDLMKHLRVRLLASLSPDHLIRLVQTHAGRDFVDCALEAYKGANPLFDIADWLIMACWDNLDRIFQGPFCCFAYVEKEPPGLSKWRDRAAAVFVDFVRGVSRFYDGSKKARAEDPQARPYALYKKRRQNLDLHPHKRPVITEARWDRSKNVLYMASEADGWAWELRAFF
jgi:hypothetical protein